MYKAVVQAVLLYRSESWVVTGAMMMVLEGFHQRTALKIAGMTARKRDDGEWEWSSVDVALEFTRIWLIREYVRKRQATIVEYLAGIRIYELFTGV